MVDMARRTLAARGRQVRLVPTWQNGIFGVEMAGEVLLPGRTPGSRPRRSRLAGGRYLLTGTPAPAIASFTWAME
jgi:hypothetical protein